METTIKNKIEVKVKKGDREVKLAVLRPNYQVRQAAERVKNRAFRESVEGGALVRAGIDKVMRDQKLWDDNKEKEFKELREKIRAGEEKLAKGKMRLADARKVALDIRADRRKISLLSMDRNALDQHTAEAQAENVQFNYQLALSVVYGEAADSREEGDPYWPTYEAFLATETDPAFGPTGRALSALVYGSEEDFLAKLPENKFLKKYGYANDKFQLVDKQKRLIDEEGRLINDKGFLVNDKGEAVDDKGNLLADDGFLAEQGEFFDDDGNVATPTNS